MIVPAPWLAGNQPRYPCFSGAFEGSTCGPKSSTIYVRTWCTRTVFFDTGVISFSPLLKTDVSSASLELDTAHYSSPGNRQPALQLSQPVSIDVTAFSAQTHEKWPLTECETQDLSSRLWWHQEPAATVWHDTSLIYDEANIYYCSQISSVEFYHRHIGNSKNACLQKKEINHINQCLTAQKLTIVCLCVCVCIKQLVDCSTAALWWRLLIGCWTVRCPGCERSCWRGSSRWTPHTAERQSRQTVGRFTYTLSKTQQQHKVCVCECLTLLYMCCSVSLALDTDRSVFSTNFSPLAVS